MSIHLNCLRFGDPFHMEQFHIVVYGSDPATQSCNVDDFLQNAWDASLRQDSRNAAIATEISNNFVLVIL